MTIELKKETDAPTSLEGIQTIMETMQRNEFAADDLTLQMAIVELDRTILDLKARLSPGAAINEAMYAGMQQARTGLIQRLRAGRASWHIGECAVCGDRHRLWPGFHSATIW
jgi:hypothetical protein